MRPAFPDVELAERMAEFGYALHPFERVPGVQCDGIMRGTYGVVPVKVTTFDHDSYYVAYILADNRRVARLTICRLAHGWHISMLSDWARWLLGKSGDLDKVEPVEIYWGQT